MFHRYLRYIPRMNPTAARIGVRLASSSFLLRVPPPTAPRESPTPLVFVSVSELDNTPSKLFAILSSMLSEKGFTCIQTDLKVPQSPTQNSQTMMENYEAGMLSSILLVYSLLEV